MDAIDHGAKTIRALRCEVFAQTKLFEQRYSVGGENVFCALAGEQREQHCDQPAHDMGVAVAGERQNRAGGAIGLD